ncbi:hypothetical protein Tco_1153218 [Tanacetum coccineum]
MGDENPIRTLGDYSKPSHEGYRNTIELPEGNNVVPLRSDTIRLVQNGCSFHGLRSEDPNQHLKDFLKLLAIGLNAFQQDPSPHGRILLPDSLLNSFHLEGPQNSARYLDVPTTSWRIFIRSMDSLQGLKDLALYDNKSWNDPRDFAKPVKEITLPQDVLSTSVCRLIKLENQVQRLMEAYLASTQLTQVNKIIASCEICNGPHDNHNFTEGPEQACVDYASSHTNEIRDKKFISIQGPRNFNDVANTWKDNPNFNWERTQTFTNPQNESISIHSSSYQIKLEKALLDFDSNQEKRLSHLHTQFGQHQDDMIGKINLFWKLSPKSSMTYLPPKNAGNFMAHKNIVAISHYEKEELRKKGIKSPSKLFSPKYISPASIKELNKNPSALKRVHFVNSIVILSKDSDTQEEDTSSTNAHEHELDDMERRSKGIKEHGKEDDEIETNMKVEEVIEEEESESETDEEVEEVFKEEEEDEDDESFNSFLTMKELFTS